MVLGHQVDLHLGDQDGASVALPICWLLRLLGQLGNSGLSPKRLDYAGIGYSTTCS